MDCPKRPISGSRFIKTFVGARGLLRNYRFMPSGALNVMKDVPVFRILNSGRKEAQEAQNFESFVPLMAALNIPVSCSWVSPRDMSHCPRLFPSFSDVPAEARKISG